jgi:hypothetical protein
VLARGIFMNIVKHIFFSNLHNFSGMQILRSQKIVGTGFLVSFDLGVPFSLGRGA